MRDGLRYALLVVAGLIGVLFIVAFTAWGLTTYGSVRHVIGDMAAQPDKAVALQNQYDEMVIAFAAGGDAYTFRYNGVPIEISGAMAAGRGQDAVIGLVLDDYASDLYHGRLTSGGLAAVSALFNATANLIYLLIALMTLFAFAALLAGAIMLFPQTPLPDRLMGAGNVVALVCVLAFLFFAFTPGLIKSLAWGYVGNTDAARDIIDVLEPALVGALLRNTLVVLILGGLVSGAGFYLEYRDREPGNGSRNAPPPTFEYRGPQQYQAPRPYQTPRPKQAPPANNRKRRSL